MKPLFTKKRLLSLLAVVLGLVLLAGALPRAGKMLLALAGARLGMELHIAEIGGNIFNHVTIGSLQGTRRDNGQPLAEFAAAAVRLDYSLPALFRGRDAFLAELRVVAATARFVLEPAAAEETDTGSAGGGEVALPALLPRLAVQDLDLTIRTADYEVSAADTSLQVGAAAEQSGQPVAVDMADLRLHSGGRTVMNTSCRLRLLYAADRIRIEEMSVPDRLASLQGELTWGKVDQPASFRVQAEAGGGRLQGSGSFGAEQSSLQVQLDDLDIAELARLLHFEDFSVAGRLSGSVASRLQPAEAGLPAIDLELRLTEGQLFGRKTEARLQGRIKDNLLLATKFTARYGANEAELTEGSAPLTLFTDWSTARLAEVTISSFTLHLQDIPALLAAPVPDVPGHVLAAQGSMGGRVLHIARADLQTEKNAATLSAARLQLKPSGGSFLDSAMAGGLRFRIGDLQELSTLFALPAMAGEAHGEAEISGTLRHPAGRITLAGENLAYGLCPLGDVTAEARADSDQLHIASLKLRNGADTLEASGDYLYQTGRFAGITGQVLIEDVGRYSAVCLGLEEKTAGRFAAAVTTTEAGELRADLQLTDAGLAGYPVAGMHAVLTTDWREYRISDAELQTKQAALRFAALITPQTEAKQVRADLLQLTLSRGSAAFALAGPAPLLFSYGDRGRAVEVGEMRLAGGDAEITLQGTQIGRAHV